MHSGETLGGGAGFKAALGLWGKLAAGAGKAVALASRLSGRGAGGMIGGSIALKLDSQLLAKLGRGRTSTIVSGTNGKSTTNRMIRECLTYFGEVAANLRGDNMPPGIATALMASPHAHYCALEVDEMHVPHVAGQVQPNVLILLNLSRDQLDRVGEISKVEERLRQAVNENPDAIVVANCDDPLIASAAWDAKHVVWVAAGTTWTEDSTSFPRGGGRVVKTADNWEVTGFPQYRRPEPDWWIEDAVLRQRGGESFPLQLSVPGRANLGNAAQAIAAAVALGVPAAEAVRRVSRVKSVSGRYATYAADGRQAHLLLAKNPAGWQESLRMVPPEASQVVVVVNGQIPDGVDLSWLWDVPFEQLRDLNLERVVASGERAADLAVRLDYAGVDAQIIPDSLAAIRACSPGRIEVLANYTGFRDLVKKLAAAGFQAGGREPK